MEWIWMWMVLLAPAAIIGIMIWRVIRRGYQMRDLVERGKPITGEVVDKVTRLELDGGRRSHPHLGNAATPGR